MPRLQIKWRDVFFILIGALCGTIANNWSYFSFDRSIGIADLFTAIIGGYIGLYVGSKLTSKVSSDRTEKDLIINEIISVRGYLNRLNSLIDSGIIPLTEAINLFKSSSQGLAHINEIIGICDFNLQFQNNLTTILGSVRILNNKITSINSINNIITIQEADRPQYIIEIRNISKQLMSLTISINRIGAS